MALILLVALAWGHDQLPGALVLTERGDGSFEVVEVPATDGGRRVGLRPVWPAGCVGREVVRCEQGLQGEIGLTGLGRSTAVVTVRWRDGRVHEDVVRGGQAVVELGGPQRLSAFGWLGLEHVLGGWDHLAFVAALALVARRARELLGAVTAFTLGHGGTTLAVAIGGWQAPMAAVEVLIALSVAWMAREALVHATAWSRWRLWWVAGVFGLLHGLGFGQGLSELSEGPTIAAVAAFLAGVEVGQLVVVAIVAGLLAATVRWAASVRWGLGLAIGGLAARWAIERLGVWWPG